MPRMGAVELLLDYAFAGQAGFNLAQNMSRLRAFARALGNRGIKISVTFKGGGQTIWSEDISDALGFCLQNGWLRELPNRGAGFVGLPSDEGAATSLRAVVERTDGFQHEIEKAYEEALGRAR